MTTRQSLSTPFLAIVFAVMLLVAGCANSLTGPDAAPAPADDETVQAQPFDDHYAPNTNGEGSTQYDHAPNTSDED